MLLLYDLLLRFFERHVGRNSEDILSRRHDFARGHVVQIQSATHDLLLQRGQEAEVAAGGHHALQLVR